MIRSLTLCAALVALLLVRPPLLLAQEPLSVPPTGTVFLPRFDWRMNLNWLSYDDERFTWDTHFVGDVDLVSFQRARVSLLGDYQALLGEEFRPFDPYQSNYRLEGSASTFFARTEVALLVNHVSRHLGDRPNRRTIAQNSVGPRVMHRFGTDQTWADVRIEARKVTARSYVDYTWMNLAEITVRHRVSPSVSLFGRGYAEVITVDPAIAGRDTQRGGRGEGGVRLAGARGAMELFGGYEQVIDADPLDRMTRQWAFVGLRLLNN
jgi:hypothetical protein